MKFNKDRFRFQELYINSDTGKSSGSGFCGVWGFLVSLLVMVAAAIAYFLKLPFAGELMGNVIIVLGICSALLGVRKLAKQEPTKEEGMDV